MTAYAIPAHALARLDGFVSTGRIIRWHWRSVDEDGIERACLLAALDPERIRDAADCPAAWMPQWLAEITLPMDDLTSEAARPGVIRRWQGVARRINCLTEAGSRRAMLRTLDAALEIAEPLDTGGAVAHVRALIAREIEGDPPTPKEWVGAAALADERDAGAAYWAALGAGGNFQPAAATTARLAEQCSRAAAAAAATMRGLPTRGWRQRLKAEAEARAAVDRAGESAVDRIAERCLTALEQEVGL